MDKQRNNLPIVGQDIPFSVIEDEYCKVLFWDDSPIGSDGSITPISKIHPYGFLEVEGKNTHGPAKLYLTSAEDCQTMDLIAVRAVIDMEYKKDDAELLIIWTTKQYKTGLDTHKPDLPRLQVFAFHKGFYFFNNNHATKADYSGYTPYEEFIHPIVWAQPVVMG